MLLLKTNKFHRRRDERSLAAGRAGPGGSGHPDEDQHAVFEREGRKAFERFDAGSHRVSRANVPHG